MEAALRAAHQQQAALQQHLQQAMSSGGQGQDLNGILPQQLQQMLALQQQAILQQQRQAQQAQAQQQRQGHTPTNGTVSGGEAVTGDDWAAEPLFGGAMEMELPMRFHDISKFRPVPDHQEVFADAHQDQSLVMEILEMAKVENEACAHYFFEDLAVQNDAQSSALETVYTLTANEVPNLPPNSVCTCALGYQTIAKGRQAQDTSNYVQIILGVVRLPQVQSDIVISLNTPAYIHEKSASAEHAGAGAKTAYIRAPELFKRMLQSFKILDMGLFGSS